MVNFSSRLVKLIRTSQKEALIMAKIHRLQIQQNRSTTTVTATASSTKAKEKKEIRLIKSIE
jgi:hypothetical protein